MSLAFILLAIWLWTVIGMAGHYYAVSYKDYIDGYDLFMLPICMAAGVVVWIIIGIIKFFLWLSYDGINIKVK